MKTLATVITAATVGLLAEASVFAKGGGGSNPQPPPPAPVHHAASAPGVTPIGGGLPHNFSGPGPYRPLTLSTGSGNRTLVYPAVHNSTVRSQAGSNTSGLNSVKQGGGNVPVNAVVVPRGKNKLDPQTVARLKNSNSSSTAAQAQLNNANQRHHHHDHDWWRHHCLALIFFDWGWWGWYDGWWYPAWGYDPYSNYEYSEPIYGAAGFTPDQIVAGVQTKLQQLGYYTYAIDGKMGPLTQGAIARYQRDHHMSITSGIDQPTLTSLGIIH
jgi:Putative peptidoglycan binding domain